MNRLNIPIIGAIITALLSTLCCLPAFLFLFFGISGGILTYFTTLEFIRIPMAILTLVIFIYGIYKMNKKNICSCQNKSKLNNLLILTFGFVIAILLFYPELLSIFMETL